jgi:hypothetical protein
MAWEILNVSLSVSDTTIACEGGKATATVSVTGKTDGSKTENHYTASLRDDHFMPDILWDSGRQSIGPDESLQTQFEVEIWCDRRGKVVGPAGSSHERTAELYAYVSGEEMEGQSDNISVSCK